MKSLKKKMVNVPSSSSSRKFGCFSGVSNGDVKLFGVV